MPTDRQTGQDRPMPAPGRGTTTLHVGLVTYLQVWPVAADLGGDRLVDAGRVPLEHNAETGWGAGEGGRAGQRRAAAEGQSVPAAACACASATLLAQCRVDHAACTCTCTYMCGPHGQQAVCCRQGAWSGLLVHAQCPEAILAKQRKCMHGCSCRCTTSATCSP